MNFLIENNKNSYNHLNLSTMRKIFFLLMWLVTGLSYAHTADLFRYDARKVEQSLVTANLLDKYVSSHHTDWYAVKNQANFLLRSFVAEDINLFNKGPESLMGIPPFWWGFVLNWVGVLLVYFITDQNKEYATEALYGCIAGSLLYVGLSFALWGGYGCLLWR